MDTFANLKLNSWRQFDTVDLDLSANATILTGSNGCGKTTILNVLNNHFGWSAPLVATPRRLRKRLENIWSDMFLKGDPSEHADRMISIGSIGYDSGHTCAILTSYLVSAQYSLSYSSAQHVIGLHIPSHRPVANYNHIANLPTQAQSAAQSYQEFQQNTMQFTHGHGSNPGRVQKQSIMSFAVFGEGNSSVPENTEMKDWFSEFQEKLLIILPKSLGFKKIEVRMPEVVLITESGEFSIDAMSGGINALFSVAWQIFMFGHDKKSFTITFDEPENHLHPNMQRSLIPNLTVAFPNCKFIIATHSPFIISSFEEANVYGLSRTENLKISSTKLDLDDLAGTPNDILREILDVESNLPIWVEDRIRSTLKNAEHLPPAQRGEKIMEDLNKLGLANAISEFKA